MRKSIVSLAVCALMISSCTCNNESNTAKHPTGIEHVIVIGIDGLNSAGLENSITPNMDRMISGGAYCDAVRNVFPISSSPNWATLLSGVGTEAHGVISNGWYADSASYEPLCKNEQNRFPTIFSVIRAQQPEAELGAIYDWNDFYRLFERELVNKDFSISPERETTKAIVEYIKEKKPTLLFTQLDNVDHCGHTYGWMSQGYYDGITAVDSLVGDILTSIEDAGIAEKTLVILVADHGGKGTTHGSSYDSEELAVPIILYGKGVKKGYKAATAIYTMDCAPTITFALGLEDFSGWRGRAISEAFEGFSSAKDIVNVRYLDKSEF
ncbi:MAG: ectonucleotide pyrophosphatase/phosphodiesterase [Rikenellaceae bacterium]